MKKKNCKEQIRSRFKGNKKKMVKEKKPTSSQTRHRFKKTIKYLYQDNFIVKVVLSKKKVKSDPMPITRVYKRSNNRYRKNKLTYSEKKKKEKKKYFNQIKKLNLKCGKSLSIGIRDCWYKCQINEITEKYISVRFNNGYTNKYSLKNLKIMMKHADYLKNIEKRRAEIRLKMRYRVFQF